MNNFKLKSSIACLLLLRLSITKANPMGSLTIDIRGRGFNPRTTDNLARVTRNATSSRQDFQPEIQADLASISFEPAAQNDEEIVVNGQDDSFSIQYSTEKPVLSADPDMLVPFWDSTKIDNPEQIQEEDSPISVLGDSKPNLPQQENSFKDLKKETERLQKVVSALHLNRVLGTSAPPPASRRAFDGALESFERHQRTLGFPNLITNTLDNFHHQLDWSRFSAFF